MVPEGDVVGVGEGVSEGVSEATDVDEALAAEVTLMVPEGDGVRVAVGDEDGTASQAEAPDPDMKPSGQGEQDVAPAAE